MVKRIVAISVILIGSTVAWLVLAASISFRTNNSENKLRSGVEASWGVPQRQLQPTATLEESALGGSAGAQQTTAEARPVLPIVLNAERSRVHVDHALDYRQKGLLWYATYVVQFAGAYTFRNSTERPRRMSLNFFFPAEQALYDDLTIARNGEPLAFSADRNGAAAWILVPAGQAVEFRVAYKSRGLASWRYSLGTEVRQTRDFALLMNTNFGGIDFPPNTLSPTQKKETKAGWELTWQYRDLVSGFEIGTTMPEKLQPGPFAAEISLFAPVSLLLFFFVLFMLTVVRKVELHPMN